jgi:putative transposase
MYAFLDAHRPEYGVEPICRVLQIAPSGSHAHRARQADPTRRSARARRDDTLRAGIRRVWRDDHEVYGVREAWPQPHREGKRVARCTVARRMRAEGLRGVGRGVGRGGRGRTTRPAEAPATAPQDLVQRRFTAERPNQLWWADFTYGATWRGVVYVAIVIDAISRRIVGWRAHTTTRTDLALDALEQALDDRATDGQLVHHSDRGSQGVSTRYTERLVAAGVAPSVASVGDAYDCEYPAGGPPPRLTPVMTDLVSWR